MARYGRIIHSEFTVNNITFENVAARREFAKDFENYHASHDHDGEVPRFEEINASELSTYEIADAQNRKWGDKYLTIDGYQAHEIYEYHTWDGWGNRPRYKPPTTCISPLIVLEAENIRGDGPFVDSGTLERHALSSIFGDMPDEDFASLMESIKSDGFFDPLIRMHEGQVLDGWHRYRAALELNIVRRLKFTTWNTEDEGDPESFVLARNIERRHLTPGQRAQIAVSFNERFGHGGDRKSDEIKSPNGDLKSRQELAKQANVGTRTIDRAVQVEKSGQAEAVIAGEKSASEVIEEMTVNELWKQIKPAISEWKQAREGVGHASKTMFIKATLRWEGLPADTETDVKILKQLLYLLTTTDTNILEEFVRKQLDGKSLWDMWDRDDDADVKDRQPDAEKENLPLQNFLDEAKETETESDREAVKLLKSKKQVLKAMWETRIEVARFYTGDGDTDLNQHLTLPELEKGFAENNPAYAEAFKVAMQRISSVASLDELVDRVLILDIGILQLETENRALTTYIGDLRNWRRPDWSPDTNWILPLIQAKKAAAAPEPEATEPVAEETADTPESEVNELHMNARWDAFNKQYPKWKEKYAESGYKENDLIQAATEAELFDALRSYRHSDKTGLPTAAEIEDVTDLMKRQSYPFSRHVRNLLREKKASVEEDTSLANLNLPMLEGLLDTLLDTVGTVDPSKRHTLSVAVLDMFSEKFEGVTEREILSTLIDCAHSVVCR